MKYQLVRFYKSGGTDKQITDIFRVKCESPASQIDILALPDVPKLKDLYVHPVTKVTNAQWKVTNREITNIAEGNREWEITITYTNASFLVARTESRPPDADKVPWERRSQVRLSSADLGTATATRAFARVVYNNDTPVYLDAEGNSMGVVPTAEAPTVPVVNSAYDHFSPGPEKNITGASLVITTHVNTQPAFNLMGIYDTLNSVEKVYGAWVIPPLQGKLVEITVTDQEYGTDLLTRYWTVSYTIQIARKPHFVSIADMGYRHLVAEKQPDNTFKVVRQPIMLKDKRRPTNPEFLLGDGQWAGDERTGQLVREGFLPVERLFLLNQVHTWETLPYRS